MILRFVYTLVVVSVVVLVAEGARIHLDHEWRQMTILNRLESSTLKRKRDDDGPPLSLGDDDNPL